MLSTRNSWNTFLTKLGISRQTIRKSDYHNYLARRLRMESLEDRRLLAVITVNTTVDEYDENILDGDVSLRDAIDLAQAGDTIIFSTNPAHGLNGGTISLLSNLGVASPLAQGLLGKKVGDKAEVEVPAGTNRFEIKEIRFDEAS